MSIRELTSDDALYIARRLREVDSRECYCVMTVETPEQIAIDCMGDTNVKLVCCAADGEPVAMFGINFLGESGAGWLLATDRWNEVWIECTRAIKRIRNKLEAQTIVVMTAAFHVESHKWLELIGFKRDKVFAGFGKNGEDFYLMSGKTRG